MTSGKYIIGIDPGTSGAYSVLDQKTLDLIEWGEIPTGIIGEKTKIIDANALREILEPFSERSVAVVEKVSAMPGQGVVSMFSFGRSLGTIEGILAGLKIPVLYITPQKWKKEQGLISKNKDASRILVNQMYPKTPFRLKKDNGITDAILIARTFFLSNLFPLKND
jgi:crossover junction endodeoxyribonuclease RuvC